MNVLHDRVVDRIELLAQLTRSERQYDHLEQVFSIVGVRDRLVGFEGSTVREQVRNLCATERWFLLNSEQFFFERNVSELCKIAADKDMPDFYMSEDMFIERKGICVFEHPVQVPPVAQGERPTWIVAFAWKVFNPDLHPARHNLDITSFNLYNFPGTEGDAMPPMDVDHMFMSPINSWNMSDMSIGSIAANNAFDNSLVSEGRISEGQWALKFICTCIVFMSQKLLVYKQASLSRPARKRAARLYEHVPDIKVVELRARRYQDHGVSTESDTEWNYRWIVRGHWHTYKVGPGRNETRLLWIEPYLKGPEDKPLKEIVHTVFDVRR